MDFVKPLRVLLRRAFGIRLTSAPRLRRTHRAVHALPAAVQPLETRTLLSFGDIYPDLVPTVGVYDENAVQANTVDTVASGSHMTAAEFADRVAAAWATNDGGVIDGSADGTIFGYGADNLGVLHMVSLDDTGRVLDTPTDRSAISGNGAFASIHSPSQGGKYVVNQYFAVESFEPNRQVLEFGLTVLGQSLGEFGYVGVYGHLASGGYVQISHFSEPGVTEDVFYGLQAPAGDYFTGFTLGYDQVENYNIDRPIWFDDFGFITGDYVAAGNYPPVADNDSYTLDENGSLTTFASPGSPGDGVLANDLDWNYHPLSAILVAGPFYGTLDWNPDGSFTYTPEPGFNGTDSFYYKANDGYDDSEVATVYLEVTPALVLPVAEDDAFVLDEDSVLNVDAVAGLLSNDVGPEGVSLAADLVSGPAHGLLTLNADGSFVYTPDVNFDGTDSFTYRTVAGSETSNVATVTLSVTDVNSVPVATGESYQLDENSELSVGGTGVLANDTDQDGDLLSAQLVAGPALGSLTLHPDGSFSYTPLANFHGSVSFTYRVSDGSAISAPVSVTLNVISVNAAPIASDDAYVVDEDQTLVLSAGPTAALSMVSDPGDYIGQGQTYDLDQTTGTFTAERNFDNGVRIHYSAGPGDYWYLQFAAPGEVPLTAGVYTGATRFPFQDPDAPGLSVYGQGRGSNTLTGEFTIHEVVYGPGGEVLVFDASFEQHNNGGVPALRGHVRYVAADPGGVLANDSDADGDALSAVLVSGPANGTVSLDPDGRFEYTPDADFFGTDTFTYQASDGVGTSEVRTVSITVTPSNDGPVAADQSVTTDEDAPLTGSVTALDVDGDLLQYSLVDGPTHGNVVLNADGTFTYTPAADFHGSDSFTFVASDGQTLSPPATIDITVAPSNDAPVAADQSVVADEDVTLAGNVTAVDVDSDPMQYSLLDEPANGNVVLNTDGTFTYTPDPDFHGSDSFTFIASDGTNDSSPATVSISVVSVNDAPTLLNAAFSLPENSPVGTIVGAVSGTDVDGDALAYEIVGGNASGAFAVDAATGVISIADASSLDFETTPQFSLTIEVADGGGLVATATVIVTLTDVAETQTVAIDVRPGNASNTIRSWGNGRIEVAILATASFDVQNVDVESLRFGRTGLENSLRWKYGEPVHHYEDVNGDGLLDLIVEFKRDWMGFTAGDTTAYLSGQLLDGTQIAGADSVNLTGSWPD